MEPNEFEFLSADNKAACLANIEAGVVTFVIQVDKDSAIRGTELFNRMMDYFGAAAVALRGVWVRGHGGRQSINIDKVNELATLGVPLLDAINQAWTVTRARKRGYSTVSVELVEPTNPPYSRIVVLISK